MLVDVLHSFSSSFQVGAYRYLLLSFAVVDILISIIHFVVVPVCIDVEDNLKFAFSPFTWLILALSSTDFVSWTTLRNGESSLVKNLLCSFTEFIVHPTFIADLMFIALFYQTFVLLAFHYVYRYVLLCKWVILPSSSPSISLSLYSVLHGFDGFPVSIRGEIGLL